MTLRLIVPIFTFAIIGFSGLLQAENIYRWVDANGVVTYGDRPEVGSEPVQVRNGKAVPPKDAPQKTASKNPDESMDEIRENQCKLARKRYSEFSNSAQIVETDEFGKKRELDAEERLTSIAKAKGDVESYCDEK